jgi:hypothetical protein
MRLTMITANREWPGEVDDAFRKLKPRLGEAVAEHRSL